MREEERRETKCGRLAMPRHPLHDLYTGNTALASDSTPFAPLFLPFPLLSCRKTTSATSLQRVRCITFGGFLQGPLGSTYCSSSMMATVNTVLAPEMHVGIKSEAGRQLRQRFDFYDFNTSAGKSWLKPWNRTKYVPAEKGSKKLWSCSDL